MRSLIKKSVSVVEELLERVVKLEDFVTNMDEYALDVYDDLYDDELDEGIPEEELVKRIEDSWWEFNDEPVKDYFGFSARYVLRLFSQNEALQEYYGQSDTGSAYAWSVLLKGLKQNRKHDTASFRRFLQSEIEALTGALWFLKRLRRDHDRIEDFYSGLWVDDDADDEDYDKFLNYESDARQLSMDLKHILNNVEDIEVREWYEAA